MLINNYIHKQTLISEMFLVSDFSSELGRKPELHCPQLMPFATKPFANHFYAIIKHSHSSHQGK